VSVHVRLYNIFPLYLINGTFSRERDREREREREREKRVFEHKICILILSKNLVLKHFSF